MQREWLIFNKGRVHALINSVINVNLSFTLDRRDSVARNLSAAYRALKRADEALDLKIKETEKVPRVKRPRKKS